MTEYTIAPLQMRTDPAIEIQDEKIILQRKLIIRNAYLIWLI